MNRFFKKLLRAGKRAPKPKSAADRYAGFTRPNIPHRNEWEPTYTRCGGHVIIGRPGSGTGLTRNFLSSHESRPKRWTP